MVPLHAYALSFTSELKKRVLNKWYQGSSCDYCRYNFASGIIFFLGIIFADYGTK